MRKENLQEATQRALLEGYKNLKENKSKKLEDKNNKYYYEINFSDGSNKDSGGYSKYFTSNEDVGDDAEFIWNLAVKAGVIEGEEWEDVEYGEQLTKEEYEEYTGKKVESKKVEGFDHINDVWNYLEKSKNEEDLEDRIGDIPSKFGTFTYELINNGETARVRNDYEEYDDYDYDEVDIDFLDYLEENKSKKVEAKLEDIQMEIYEMIQTARKVDKQDKETNIKETINAIRLTYPEIDRDEIVNYVTKKADEIYAGDYDEKTENKKTEAYNYNWIDDIDEVENTEENDELVYAFAENLMNTDPDYADYDDPWEIISNIISIWKINKRSRLYDYLIKWYGSEEEMKKHIRSFYETNDAIYFETGTGYSIFDADLLGGNADGRTADEFGRFVANGGVKEESKKVEEAKLNFINNVDELPDMCYGLLPSDNSIIIIKKGESGYYETDLGSPENAEEVVNGLNDKMGITPDQRFTMEIRSINNNWENTKTESKKIEDKEDTTSAPDYLEKAFEVEVEYWLKALVDEDSNDEIGKKAQEVLDDKAKMKSIVDELVNGSDDLWEDIHRRIEELAGLHYRESSRVNESKKSYRRFN